MGFPQSISKISLSFLALPSSICLPNMVSDSNRISRAANPSSDPLLPEFERGGRGGEYNLIRLIILVQLRKDETR